MSRPLMKCGHAAQGRIAGTDQPVCAICYGLTPGASEVDQAPPDLAGREARCSYHDEPRRPSSYDLAFFQHRPDQPTDIYYCGCYGWD